MFYILYTQVTQNLSKIHVSPLAYLVRPFSIGIKGMTIIHVYFCSIGPKHQCCLWVLFVPWRYRGWLTMKISTSPYSPRSTPDFREIHHHRTFNTIFDALILEWHYEQTLYRLVFVIFESFIPPTCFVITLLFLYFLAGKTSNWQDVALESIGHVYAISLFISLCA